MSDFYQKEYSKSYWLDVPLISGDTTDVPKKASVVVIGSGLSGTSVGYFLNEHGFEDVVVIDYKSEQAASYRNAGHILYGTVESMKALSEIHTPEKAKEIWSFSIQICNQVEETMKKHGIQAEYKRDGYLVIAISEVEDRECRDSVQLLNSMDFQSDYVDAHTIRQLDFKNCYGARYEKGSAQAHPVKFRNGLMDVYLKQGGKYFSNLQVLSLNETPDGVEVHTQRGVIHADAAVIAANAYSPLFSDFFKSRGLIDPYRGQIIASKPLKHQFKVRYPHSFDHGYQYATISQDNRLIIGGWRQHTTSREMGIYSLDTNPFVEDGLKQFVSETYDIAEPVEWAYSWSGIMAASRTSLPFIGNTTSPRIYCCCAYTGHGFSWAHGSAQLLANIIAGAPIPEIAKHFNPKVM